MCAVHLQKKLGATMFFQIPDEEKFFFKDGVTIEQTTKWTEDNILDIIAMDFGLRRRYS